MKKFFCVIFLLCFLGACVKKDCPSPSSVVNKSNTVYTSSVSEGTEFFDLILQDSSTIKDAYLSEYYPDNNYGTNPKIFCSAWTYGFVPASVLFLLKFDYSLIPSGKRVKKATLNLYTDVTNVYTGSPLPDKGHYGANVYWSIKRVLDSWDQSTVTYRNRPFSTEFHKVSLGSPISNTMSYIDIDVTDLVKDQLRTSNHGFEVSLDQNIPYKRLAFYSANTVYSDKIPLLRIIYE